MLKFGSAFKGLNDQNKLIQELANENSLAIQFILKKVNKSCTQIIKKMGLPTDIAQDILHDGLILFIKKIKDQSYNPSISAPQTFLLGICKNLALNLSRSKKVLTTIELEEFNHPFADVTQQKIQILEIRKFVGILLNEIGSPCKELIRLKYIEGYKDEELLNLKLTSFSSLESLRVTRSQCMKKIIQISSKYRNIYEN